MLIQHLAVQQTSGWACELRRSSHAYYCGMLSYETEFRPIEFMHAERVNAQDCRRWVIGKMFRDPNTNRYHQLHVPGLTTIQSPVVGRGGQIDGTVECIGGVYTTADGQAHRSIVIEAEYQIHIQKVTVRSMGSEVEAGAHHLPCRFEEGHCATSQPAVFIWNATRECPLRRLNYGKATLEQGRLYMQTHHVELSVSAQASLNVTGCTQFKMYETEVPHVYVAVDREAALARHFLKEPTAAEIDPRLDDAVRFHTLDHQNQRTMAGQQPRCRAAGQPSYDNKVVVAEPASSNCS